MFYYLYKDVAGFWRWTLYAGNNRKIANSGEGYHNKSDALSAVNLVKSTATTPVREARAA